MGSRTSSSSLGTSWCIPDTVLTPLGPVTTITLVYKSCNFIEGKTLIKLSLISTVEALVLMWWFFCRLYHKWRLLFEIPLRKDQRTPVNIFLSNQEFDKRKAYICFFITVQWWWLVDNIGSGFAAERELRKTSEHFMCYTRLFQSSLWIIRGNLVPGQEKKILLPFSLLCKDTKWKSCQ